MRGKNRTARRPTLEFYIAMARRRYPAERGLQVPGGRSGLVSEQLLFPACTDWPSPLRSRRPASRRGSARGAEELAASSLHRAVERLNFFRSVTIRFATGCFRAAYSD